MAGWTVSEAKYVTCVCGKVCKGRAAHANHARKCEMEAARSELFIICVEKGIKPLNHAQFARLWEGNREGVRQAIERNKTS